MGPIRQTAFGKDFPRKNPRPTRSGPFYRSSKDWEKKNRPRSTPYNQDPQLSPLLSKVHHLLDAANPKLASDCWLCLCPGPLQHVASPIGLSDLTKFNGCPGWSPDSADVSPKSVNIQLAHTAPDCIYNSGTEHSVGNLATAQCAQTHNCTTVYGCMPAKLWCTPSPGCGAHAYQCLPASWTGTCTLTFLAPQMDIIPSNQSLPVPLMTHTQSKRAIQLTPLLIRLGIATGVGYS